MAAKHSANGTENRDAPQPLLRRADQAVVATLILFALLGLAAYWVALGGPRGELIEIDRAEPLTALPGRHQPGPLVRTRRAAGCRRNPRPPYRRFPHHRRSVQRPQRPPPSPRHRPAHARKDAAVPAANPRPARRGRPSPARHEAMRHLPKNVSQFAIFRLS
jgi:hypothetical protein